MQDGRRRGRECKKLDCRQKRENESLPCFVLRSNFPFCCLVASFGRSRECRCDDRKRQKAWERASSNTARSRLKKNQSVLFFCKNAAELFKTKNGRKLSLLFQTKSNHASSADSVGWSSPSALVVIPASVEAS